MQKKHEVATLTSQDLTSAGILSQLSSNDLVEVVAHDIYDNYLKTINDVEDRGNEIKEQYSKLFDSELNKMRSALSKYLLKDSAVLRTDDAEDYSDEDFEGIVTSFVSGEKYWPQMSMSTVYLKEKDKGTVGETSSRSFAMPNFKETKASVKLTITAGVKTEKQPVKIGSITGEIENTTKKTFTQVITVNISRFKQFAEVIAQHNKDVAALVKLLPKNGVLSVERFTREARVKMNKKIISNQSPDFKEKISALFSIKL